MTGTTLTDRAILRISGEEARPFLQGLLTRDVLTLRADNPRWTGLLSPQGKALFDFILWGAGDEDQGNDVLIDCEATQADALARRGTMTQQMEAQTSLRDSARVAYTLSEARFRAGVDSFLTTLDSQRTLYTAEQSLLATRLTRATNMVELYRAMGGGLN